MDLLQKLFCYFLYQTGKGSIMRLLLKLNVNSQGASQVLFDDVIRHFPNPFEFPN